MVFNNNKPIRVSIIGASGYGGIQAITLLRNNPNFTISYLGGNRTVSRKWSEVCPFLPLDNDLDIEKPDLDLIAERSDFAILSLPNGLSSKISPELLQKNIRILDLSADYRYRSLSKWLQEYSYEAKGIIRNDEQLCAEAVYGLPEWNFDQIRNAKLVACPGCYPTASLLGLLPFLKQGLIENDGIIIDAKSGTSGGGRDPKQQLLLSESSESISPYSVVGHRHTSEIEQQASLIAGTNIEIQFTPHLVPMVRGLLSTVYARLRDPCLTAEDCTTVLKAIYKHNDCIQILPVGTYPSTKWVRNTCKALISVEVDKRNGRLVIMSAIDNLVKGQAGQAIQNLNIMVGIKSCDSLPLICNYP